ncbi:MAG: hypothetical protein ACMUIE_10080 [Thermoplasmatota archaeon]
MEEITSQPQPLGNDQGFDAVGSEEKLKSAGKKPPVLVSNILIGVAVVLAFMLMFVGGTLYFMNDPIATADSEDDSREILDNQNAASWLRFVGSLIFTLGLFILCGFLIVGGILRTDLPPAVRFGMLFLSGLLLIGAGFQI